MKNRNWRTYFQRLKAASNGVSGIVAFGGSGSLVAGTFFVESTSKWSLALIYPGVGLIIVSFFYVMCVAIPPLLIHSGRLVGQKVSLDDLLNVFPKIPQIGFIGLSHSGKTTLKNKLSFNHDEFSRTQSISAYITTLQTAPPSQIAIVDGSGDNIAQQFVVSENSDFLCIVVDHSRSDSDFLVDSPRLKDTGKFLTQVRNCLVQSGMKKKKIIHILWNKQDLWKNNKPEELEEFKAFQVEELKKWTESNLAEKVTANSHSNNIQNDVSQFMALIKESTSVQLGRVK
jgi:GTPase SAR1 family protein